MRIYHYAHVSFLLIFIFFTQHTTHASQKLTIIFDLTNVVIKENAIGLAKKIGYANLASYTITHWKNPGHRCLDMLEEISKLESQQPHIILPLEKRTMPRCLVELQEGKKTCAQAREEITECMRILDEQKFFSSVKEKELMRDIMDLVLDPKTVTTMIEPVKSTIQLIHKLKAAGHEVACCANVPAELYAASQQKFDYILQLFDGKIVISSHANVVKPTLLKHFLETYNLDPKNCILIDDLEISADAARKLGMQAIVCDKPAYLVSKLKKCGVRI